MGDAAMNVEELAQRVNAAAEVGMQPAVWAELTSDRVAIYDYTGQNRTFGGLNANANRVARRLRLAGLKAGDAAGALKRAAALPSDGVHRFIAPLALAWTRMAAGDLPGADAALQQLDKYNGFQPLKNFQLGLLYDFAGQGDKVKIADDHCFTGFDAYRKVIGSGVDLVILATPPGFRPIHLKAAIEAGKHVFMEKPVAVDPTGVRSVIASSDLAAQKKLGALFQASYPGRYRRRRSERRRLCFQVARFQALPPRSQVFVLPCSFRGATAPERC